MTSRFLYIFASTLLPLLLGCHDQKNPAHYLAEGFLNPPDSVRPGVYWYFMDGNISREGMTKDLESMKAAGIGSVVFLEVNLGLPRGSVDFMSDEWMDLFEHARRESERLGITIKMGVGPGWSGSGGPWVKPEESMQHLVSSFAETEGGKRITMKLPVPKPMQPMFGEGSLTPDLREKWSSWYRDVAVLAFPTPPAGQLEVDFSKREGRSIYGGLREVKSYLPEFEEKALYYRSAYSSYPGVKEFIPSPTEYPPASPEIVIDTARILDITAMLAPDGTLTWDAPLGRWTIMRFASVNNGNVTRPAPMPGLGFECDKFDTAAFNSHFNNFLGKLLPVKSGEYGKKTGGITTLHMDSWEMGTQNWTSEFREEFIKRRGYDPLPFLPAYSGVIVGSTEITERFLWDIRQTAQELVIENHAGHIKKIARKYGLHLSIEPYDINPASDLALGAVADIPMCEFWLKDHGYNTSFSCIEASSIAHVLGKPVVAAESFTSTGGFHSWPGSVKNQGDWAFAAGVNHFYYHTFAHKPFPDKYKPGMTFGPYGVHWDRSEPWWPMAGAYHKYIARCSYMLQQGRTVAEILYLTPEGAPHVFRPPQSAVSGEPFMPDRKGYNFDGCSPDMLVKAAVKDGKIAFPGGASYSVLVLPAVQRMTPALLEKIQSLAADGATVIGNPPSESQGLRNYPECDSLVAHIAKKMWGSLKIPEKTSVIDCGKGQIWWGAELSATDGESLYPSYEATATLLKNNGVGEDFNSGAPIRYTHRSTELLEIYFVSNTSENMIEDECSFATAKGNPQLWDPLTGRVFSFESLRTEGSQTILPLKFYPFQSYFIVFGANTLSASNTGNFFSEEPFRKVPVNSPWEVFFDPELGGPGKITFRKLEDWISRDEDGIRYYSGIAHYKTSTVIDKVSGSRIILNLGNVRCIAQVRINGNDMGVVWCAPWKVDITDVAVNGENKVEIEVANLWQNRLIGDEKFPMDGVKDGKFPEWLTQGKPRTSGRIAFSPVKFYGIETPLSSSGLIGPVEIFYIKEK